MRTVVSLLLLPAIVLTLGCMPEAGPPTVEGPLDTSTASQLQAKVRMNNAETFQVEHQIEGGKTFTANWLLGNALKKTSQLQIKPPADWDEVELYEAVEVVLNAHETKPWYGQIDDTVLRLVRDVIKDDDRDTATGFAPDTPYDVSVKIKKHSTEWFLQVEVVIVNEDGTSIGF